MRILRTLLVKEFKQIFRNKTLLPIMFVVPVVQMIFEENPVCSMSIRYRPIYEVQGVSLKSMNCIFKILPGRRQIQASPVIGPDFTQTARGINEIGPGASFVSFQEPVTVNGVIIHAEQFGILFITNQMIIIHHQNQMIVVKTKIKMKLILKIKHSMIYMKLKKN